MKDQNAKLGAQGIHHEKIEDSTPPDLEEKKSGQTTIDSPRGSSEQPAEHRKLESHDAEAAQDGTTPSPIKVPASKRRGLFGRFTLLAEVQEPKHYSRRIKWFITFIVALAGVAAPMGSGIIFRE